MNALDVSARGLARRAIAVAEAPAGLVSLRKRNEPTAAATEALAEVTGGLAGHPGDAYTVEFPPYIRRPRLVIRGNGAELRNTNTTPLEVSDHPSVTLPLGVSQVWATDALTYYPVLSANGPAISVVQGDEGNFSVGDLVVLHGATSFFVASGEYHVYRNYTRARVLAVAPGLVTIDRSPPPQLLADEPVIANADEGLANGIEGAGNTYMLYAPDISDLRLVSDLGSPWKWGGIIDGTFRNIEVDGRNGLVFNALQDCLFENIRFRAWRKICELAEGSCGTTVRGLRGSLSDASTKRGGASDASPFFIGLVENCSDCLIEDLIVDSGPNNPTGSVACLIASGRSNSIRKGILRFPAVTGTALSIFSSPAAGHPSLDSGFADLTVYAPVCSTFLNIGGGTGVVRPYVRNVKFLGNPTVRAANIAGVDGELTNAWFEGGSLLFTGTTTGWRIENCFIPEGFDNLTRSRLQQNTIRDNESKASRRIAAAAIVETAQTTVTSTAANNVVHTMTIAPDDLKSFDEVHFRLAGNTGGGSANTRHVRLTACFDGATEVEIAHMTTTVNGAAWAVEGTIEVQGNVVIHCSARQTSDTGMLPVDTRVTGGDLDLHGLVIRVEMWTDLAGSIATQLVKIAGQKAGMRNVPVFG